nr:LysR family transcriptional regulator [Actinomadura sp. CNU-125]
MDSHLRDLRYFVAVAEELNFTRAAERLFVSQPALSKQIRRLEDDLRVRLFDRDKRTVTLTAPGTALLPAARELLGRWDQAQREVADAAAAEASVLTVGLSTSVGRGLLGAVRDRFAERRPGWRLRMRQIDWEDASAGLASGDVDIAFVWLPVPAQDAFHLRVVAREERWVAFREATASPDGPRSASPNSWTNRSSPSPRVRARCATTGSARRTARAVRRGSARRSPTPTRPSPRSRRAAGSSCWPPGTRRSTVVRASAPSRSPGCRRPNWPPPGAAATTGRSSATSSTHCRPSLDLQDPSFS